MSVKEIPLENLHENDYNPRKRFDDAAMEDLKNSIEQVGLVQPLTVREDDDGYEVISGVRRLRALRDIFENGKEIPCYIRNVNDEKAKWIALAENLDRDDLTPLEEARAYAKYVSVKVESEKVPFDEYINRANDEDLVIRTPSNNNSSVIDLAEKINPSAGQIQKRLQLLVLPQEVQTKVEHGDVVLATADILSQLRQIPDVEKRRQFMVDLADDERFAGSSPELDKLRDRVTTLIEDYQEQQEQQEQRLEEYQTLVDERETKLRTTIKDNIEWYNEQGDGSISTNGIDDIEEASQKVIDRFQDRINELSGGTLDELDDDEDRLRREKERLQQNLNTIRQENHERCPFCKAGVSVTDLGERIEKYDREIEAVRERKSEINDRREKFRDRRKTIRNAFNDYQDAAERLEAERGATEAEA